MYAHSGSPSGYLQSAQLVLAAIGWGQIHEEGLDASKVSIFLSSCPVGTPSRGTRRRAKSETPRNRAWLHDHRLCEPKHLHCRGFWVAEEDWVDVFHDVGAHV